MKVTATYPDGTVRPLVYIDDWDFDWQDVYRYRQPFWLPKGSTVVMEFTYDNSAANRRNPDPTQRVVFGPEIMNGYFDFTVDAHTPRVTAR